MTPRRARILMVVFDGLRPDLVTPERMPVLSKFLSGACRYTNSRCVFPSSTRVNAAAFGAGSVPGVTGLTANKLFDPAVFPDRIMHTGRFEHVARAERAHGGNFINAPTLGDALKAQGLTFAVIGSGSAGTTHFANPRAVANGQVRLCLRDWSVSAPEDLGADLLARFGPIAKIGFPSTERMEQHTTLFLDGVFPARHPDVSLLWYNEPDWTQHYKGLGSVEVNTILAVLDEQFARLLHWSQSPNAGGEVCIIVASDHGHITAEAHVDLKAAFDDAGFEFRADVEGAPFAASLGNVSAIWSRTGDAARLSDLVAWLREQPWCGLIFAGDGIVGASDRRLTLNDHARSPDMFFCLRSGDEPNAAGIPGSGFYTADLPEGGAFHGGPSRWEMSNLLALSGPGIAAPARFDSPAGITDIAPTVLAMAGITPPSGMTGRVLHEAMGGSQPAEAPLIKTVGSIGFAAYGGTQYFLGETGDNP